MRPNCVCHDAPMYWSHDTRYRDGGFWRCAVAHTDRIRARIARPGERERKAAQQRDRYDADPIFRIEKRLHDDAHKRAQTLKRRKERLGEVSLEGRNRPSLEPDPTAHHP